MSEKILANCPVSSVIFNQDTEIIAFNGFAWSNKQGMIFQSNLPKSEDPSEWLGTQP